VKPIRRPLILAIFVLITLFFPLLAPPAHRIDQNHFLLIQTGMTEAEVEAIFGVPAGVYDWAVDDSMQFERLVFVRDRDSAFLPWVTKAWIGRHGAAHFTFCADGRVLSAILDGHTRIEPPWQRWWRKLTAK
jgi:hypothetical protein